MDQDRAKELQAITDYFRENPTAKMPDFSDGTPQGGQHFHVHHHYAPPVIDTSPVNQNPGQTLAEKVIPWLWTALLACIIMTFCAVILAAVIVAMVIGLVALALAAAVIAHLIKVSGESAALRGDSRINETLAKGKRRR